MLCRWSRTWPVIKYSFSTSCYVYTAAVMQLQVSCQLSAVSRQHDMNQFLTVWNSPTTMPSWSRLSNRDVTSDRDDDLKLEGAFIYSTDPDHEPDDEEAYATRELVAESDKVRQTTGGQHLCCCLFIAHVDTHISPLLSLSVSLCPVDRVTCQG